VAVVECYHLRLAEPFREGDDARIDHADPEVGVAFLEVATTCEIGRARWLDSIRAGQDIVEKQQPCIAAEAPLAPVIKLGEDERRHDEILVGAGEQCGASSVIAVGGVECRKERSRVDDERHASDGRFCDRFGGQVGGGEAVGRTCDTHPWTARRSERPGLFLNRLPEDGGEGYAPACGFGLKCPKRRRGGADRRASFSGHDA